MRPVNIIIPSLTFSSFTYCGRIVEAWLHAISDNISSPNNVTISLEYRYGMLNILIDDAYLTVNLPKVSDIAWIDTALKIDGHRVARQCRIYTCSKRDKIQLESVGLRVEDVIPRPFSPAAYIVRKKDLPKKYDLFICGWYREPDRKNFAEIREIIEKLQLKIVAITNYPLPNRMDFSRVNDMEKYRLMKMSKYVLQLSGIEGFGMPALEGMSVATPTIYLDAPAVNEFAVGYKIPVEKWIETYMPLTFFKPKIEYAKPNMKEAIEIVKQALGDYNTESYMELSMKAIEHADAMLNKTLSFLSHNTL